MMQVVVSALLLTVAMQSAAPQPAAPPPKNEPAASQPAEEFLPKWIQAYQPVIYKNAEGKSLSYRLLSPEKIEPGKTYPLVLFMHGSGASGTDNFLQITEGAGEEFAQPENRKKYPCFVVAPQCSKGNGWTKRGRGRNRNTDASADKSVQKDKGKESLSRPASGEPAESMKLTFELVDKLAAELPVDKGRIYATGLSMGGFGTWDAIQRRPEFFAAAIPVCGGGDPTQASKLTTVPIWAFHGDQDKSVPVAGTKDMIAAIIKAGGTQKMTIYPGIGHHSWFRTYTNPEVLAWLFAQRKNGQGQPLLSAAPTADWHDEYQSKIYTSDNGQTLSYRLLNPEKIDPDKTYPLVLFLHGAGERGTDNSKQLTHGAVEFAKAENRQKYPCFVVAPQCPPSASWVAVDWSKTSHTMPENASSPLDLALKLVDAFAANLPINKSRIYVTGLSMGGYGSWDAIQRRPEFFAAAIPICGGGDVAQAEKLKAIPIWAFHGDKDPTVPVSRTKDMIDTITKAGGTPKITLYPGVGHDAWTRTYADPEVLTWLFSQKK